MPSPELYKDKIEVSLDGRQIFYLFFGGAAIVGLVFVLGVMVGRRVEARGHLDRAETQTASDPLAALDRLERSDNLSFHGALTGSEPATDVEKAIGELDKRRAAGKPDKKPEAKPDAKPEARPEAKADKVEVKADKPDAKADRPEADKPKPEKHDGDKRDGDKRDGDKKPKKHDDRAEKLDKSDKPVTRPDAHADAKPDGDARTGEAKTKFTLQLSSFQDKAEAEAFLSSMKSAGFQPYLTEADVSGKGTFYRVRLGSYRSVDAANDAKAEFEKSSRKTAQVMRL
jgi:DedD protein